MLSLQAEARHGGLAEKALVHASATGVSDAPVNCINMVCTMFREVHLRIRGFGR